MRKASYTFDDTRLTELMRLELTQSVRNAMTSRVFPGFGRMYREKGVVCCAPGSGETVAKALDKQDLCF